MELNIEVVIEIIDNKVYLDEGGATMPQMTRLLIHLYKNLYGHKPPTAVLTTDQHGKLVVELISKAGNIKHDKKPALIKMILEFGEVVGGSIDHNSQTKQNVLDALNYLCHLYSKRMCFVAEELFGKEDTASQEEWMERVLNENKI